VPGASALWTSRAFDQLIADDLVERSKHAFSGVTSISITAAGIGRIEHLLKDVHSVISSLSETSEVTSGIAARANAPTGQNGVFWNVGLRSKTSEAESQEVRSTSDEVQQAEWQPLKLERGTLSEEAIATTEKAIQLIEADNGFAVAEPIVRDSIVSSVRSGLQVIKSTVPTRAQAHELLLKPLTYVAKKFADTSIGEVAKLALKALFAWFGSPF
jgi:hypothetical protein